MLFIFTEASYNLKGYEFVHPDHNYCFTWKTLSTLLMKSGYVINEILAYSCVDTETPILQRIMKNISSTGKYQCNGNAIQADMSETPSIGLVDGINKIIDILVRRYLYERNPFFADGIIFIVRPN